MNKRSQGAQRWLPLGQFGVMLLVAILILPSALRPPQNQPPTSAQFSPDAPPDDNQDSLISNLNRGQSSTAGAAETVGVGGADDSGLNTTKPTQPTKLVPNSCPRGYGQPLRQTESLYSAPCAPAFTGDNGGNTYRGVTKDEVRVGVAHSTSTFQTSYEGPVPNTVGENETSADRTYRVYQEYFNRNFQLYNRRLQIYTRNPDTTPELNRSKAAELVDQDKVFAGFADQAPALQEFARRKAIAFGGYQYGRQWFTEQQPYAWSWHMDGTSQMRFMAEYICKKLAGKNATWAGDATYRGNKRKFGILNYDDPVNWGPGIGPDLQKFLKDGCNVETVMVTYDLDAKSDQIASAMVKMRSENVTSLVAVTDYSGPVYMSAAATSQGYFPEWILTGRWLQDVNSLGALCDQQQWMHAFGISARQMQQHPSQTDWYRAYKEVDPNNEPDTLVGEYLYYPLLQILNAMQLAGPKLTPESYASGLFKRGYQFDGPTWMVGGGYSPGDFTFPDDVTEIWWDATAPDPVSPGGVGAYKYVRGGARYRLNEIPKEDTLAFKDGALYPQ